jgi:polar amino acid transport system substrate-binding protein
MKAVKAVGLSMQAGAAIGATAQGREPTSDTRVADLVRAGKVRFGAFPPQYTKDSATGELKGPFIEMMRALAAHMGLSAQLIELPTPSKLVECLENGTCDVGSLGFDPARADQVGGFTPPFIEFEFTYLVPIGTSASNVVDIDQPGNRIAVVRNHASTLALSRITRHAKHIISETPDAAFDLLRSRHVHAWASARPALLDYSAKLPGSRVLQDNYGANFPAMVVPKGQEARLAYISEFIEQAKASGVVQRLIDRVGELGYGVAVPGQR